MIETNNILSTPSGQEYEFIVGEGTSSALLSRLSVSGPCQLAASAGVMSAQRTDGHHPRPGKYVLKDDLLLATPPPHPSEAPVVNPNPLNTKVEAPKVGTRVSLISFESQSLPPTFFSGASATTLSLSGPPASIQEHPSEGRYSGDASVSTDKDRGTSSSDAAVPPPSVTLVNAPAFGDGNAVLNPANPKERKRPNKPKNNMTKSNSSFISRVIVNESLSKKLSERAADGIFAFVNINRAFQWLDLSSPAKVSQRHHILTRWYPDLTVHDAVRVSD